MFLIRNERIKLMATYLNGLAVAAAAVGGIGQIVNGSTGWVSAAWFSLSLILQCYCAGHPRKVAGMSSFDLSALAGPAMFLLTAAAAVAVGSWFVSRSDRVTAKRTD